MFGGFFEQYFVEEYLPRPLLSLALETSHHHASGLFQHGRAADVRVQRAERAQMDKHRGKTGLRRWTEVWDVLIGY